jgi:hypothetical protein
MIDVEPIDPVVYVILHANHATYRAIGLQFEVVVNVYRLRHCEVDSHVSGADFVYDAHL